jgi:hypothetical protein
MQRKRCQVLPGICIHKVCAVFPQRVKDEGIPLYTVMLAYFFGSVYFGSVCFDSVCFGSVCLGSVYFGSVRFRKNIMLNSLS